MATVLKRKAFSLAEKLDILRKYDENRGLKKVTLAKSLGIPGSTLRTILKKRNEIIKNARYASGKRQKFKTGKFDELEKILMQWFLRARAQQIAMNGPMLKNKAQEIADELGLTEFTGSNGWLTRFRQRHNIVYNSSSEDAELINKSVLQLVNESTNELANVSIDESSDDQPVTSLNDILTSLFDKYSCRDIFNATEFGLFFKLMPDKHILYKTRKCHNGELNNERLTVLLCANAEGTEKLTPLVIGKYVKPKCFKNIKCFPCNYVGQREAWMTEDTFLSWLKELNSSMIEQDRQILLCIKDSPVHPKDITLTNVEIAFLPSNPETSDHGYLQPLDQGIIKITKQNYRRRLLQRYLQMNDNLIENPITILDALHYLSAAWNDIANETIKNCFKKAAFFKDKIEFPVTKIEVEGDTTESPTIKIKVEDDTVREEETTSEDFLTFEEDPATAEEYIVGESNFSVSVKTEDSDDDDDKDNITINVPTELQALNAIDILRTYFSSQFGSSSNVFQNINTIEGAILSTYRN